LIYVERRIRCSMEAVWELTQTPSSHARWDLRFTSISPLDERRFRYSTLFVHGEGESVGERVGDERASALRFSSESRLSPIQSGSGYWRYVPDGADGVRFLTRYDYEPRSRVVDWAFRPLMAWGTAWSFDRLALWLERGVSPERALRLALARVLLALALGRRRPALLALLVVPLPGVPSARRCDWSAWE
jgi:Polyketide cyclase / dehydrase and lipid transport